MARGLRLLALILLAATLGHGSSKKETGSNRAPALPPIRGGNAVDITQFPYQAQLQYKGAYFCGASIIRSAWILTAASCTKEVTNSVANVSVRVGSATLGYGGKEYQANAVYSFDKYNSNMKTYDVGLVQLKTTIVFSSITQPVEIAHYEISEGGLAVVSGFGSVGEDYYDNYYDDSPDLLALQVSVVSRALCKMEYAQYVIDESNICAGLKEMGFCKDDAGDPLVQGGLQVAVVSHSKGCGDDGRPGIYANLAEPSVRDWIYSLTGV